MKTFYFLMLLFLISCGQEAASAGNATNEKNAVAMKAAQDAPNQAPTNTTTKDPVRGAPADITLNLKGVADGQSLLIGFSGEQHFKADSSDIVNGRIRFEKAEGYVQGIYYVSTPNKDFIQMILGEDQKFEMSSAQGSLVASMIVKGSTENEVFYQNLKFEESFNAKYLPVTERLKSLQKGSAEFTTVSEEKLEMEAERKAHLDGIFSKHAGLFFTKFKKAGQNPEIRKDKPENAQVFHYRQEFWDDVDFSDDRLLRTPVILNKLKRYIKELTPQNHDSIFKATKHLVDKTLLYPEYYKFFTNWIAVQYEPTKCTLMDPEYVFVNIVQNYFTRERAFWADSMQVYALQNRAMEMSNSVMGIQGPNVIVNGIDGQPKSLYDITSDYIIVYLYNPDCEHCAIQTPLLVEWHKQWKSKGAEVYAIVLDTNDAEWKNYVAEKGMEGFTNVFDPTNRSIYAKYYVDITPEIYVLNKDRTIIGKNLKVPQIEIVINKDKKRLAEQ